ncbi:MAG: hypothetical protein LBH42_10415 [Treponema sp.]|jgi:hypothetical protein|nr:hypothetical protein [Treponema sp.]
MTKEELEQLRDKAALSVLPKMVAEYRSGYMTAAAEAYYLADAFLAARELPGKYEHYTKQYQRKAIQMEKLRIENETHRKIMAPFHEWAKEHFNNGYRTVLSDFDCEYEHKEGQDVVEEFKAWLKTTKPRLLNEIK